MDKQLRLAALTFLSSMVVTACGGGDSTDVATPTTGAEAAAATATQNAMCVAIQPFYWEIGDKTGAPLASGSVGSGAPVRTDSMEIASASKWMYSTYVVQKLGGMANLDPALDVPYLNFTSGYTWAPPGKCEATDTVASCVAANATNTLPTTLPVVANEGFFHYNGGHMEVHANSRMGLGPDGNEALSNEVLETVTGFGNDSVTGNGYSQPLLAGGVHTSAATYASMLAGILSGNLMMHDVLVNDQQALGTALYKVPTTGGTTSSPLDGVDNGAGVQEAWNYSLGHWVEDDPTYGDHAMSSAGSLGFYPWIDKTLTYYGIVARLAPPTPDNSEGFESAQCGRLIRQAWFSGVTVTATVPTPSAE